jgi:glycerophosphoryl diester phosphodiesterase
MKKRSLRILVAVIVPVVAALVLGSLFASSAPARPFYTDMHPQVMLYAHMGGDGVWPGDTLYAYDQAAALGVDAFDMDAHITKDGHIVLMHDENVKRTTDGNGLVEELTLAELKKLDAAYNWSLDGGKTFPYRGKGISVPTLEEVFQKYPNMRYLVEIKLSKRPITEPMCALINQYNMRDRIIIASFHDDLMKQFREVCPGVATSASKGEVTAFVLLSKIGLSSLISPEYQALQVPFETSETYGIPVITPGLMQAAHAKNLKVETWTLDDPQLMQTYMTWGIDGVDTDRPDLLLPVVRK